MPMMEALKILVLALGAAILMWDNSRADNRTTVEIRREPEPVRRRRRLN